MFGVLQTRTLFEPLTSTTPWKSFNLIPPTNAAEFKALKLCPCITTGIVFEWKDLKNWPIRKDVLGTNSQVLEYAMWLLSDLNDMLRRMEVRWNQKIKEGGMISRDAPNATFAISALDILLQINALDLLPKDPVQRTIVSTNTFKDWSTITRPGEYKLPWQLIPSCNRILENWLRAEIALSIQTIKCVQLNCNDFVAFQIYAIKHLQLANTTVPGLETAFTEFLKNALILQNAIACHWLPTIYQEDFKEKVYNSVQKHHLYQHLISLCDSLPEEFSRINANAHVIEKIKSSATKSISELSIPYTTSAVQTGAALLKQHTSKPPITRISGDIEESYLLTPQIASKADYLAMLKGHLC